MNLYEINKSILDLVDTETGEIKDFEELNNLLMKKDEKIENVALFIKNLEYDAIMIKAEIDSLKERLEAKKKRADSLREYLQKFMLAEGKTKFETAKCKVSFRKTTSVKVLDEEGLFNFAVVNDLNNLYKEKTTFSIDKKAVKEYLKENSMPYAEIVESQSMSVK